MNHAKILATEKGKIVTLVNFALLVGVATIAPLFHQQAITGPIVNATLFVSVFLLGAQNAILVGLIPSLIALSVGTLPAPLAPMIPFIMMGNTILIISFTFLRRKNYWLGVILASLLKFLFLFYTTSVVTQLILKKEIAIKAATMMSWPQFLTAIAGGVLAYLFLRAVKFKIKSIS